MTDEDRERILAESRELLERRPQSYTPPPEPVRYRTHDPAENRVQKSDTIPEPETVAAPDWSGWETWVQARISAALAAEREAICEIMAEALAISERRTRKAVKHDLDKQMSELRAEVATARQSFEALRETIVAERARVLDLPALPSRTDVN